MPLSQWFPRPGSPQITEPLPSSSNLCLSEFICGSNTKAHNDARSQTRNSCPHALCLSPRFVAAARAAAWGLDTNRIGFLGYSAGGHLAATLEFFFDREVYAPVDTADRSSARPDFCVLGYAAAISDMLTPPGQAVSPLKDMELDYKVEAIPSVRYPPAFLLQADDDPAVNPQNAARIYLALKQNGTPCEMHVFCAGGHGFASRDAKGPVARWPELCAD